MYRLIKWSWLAAVLATTVFLTKSLVVIPPYSTDSAAAGSKIPELAAAIASDSNPERAVSTGTRKTSHAVRSPLYFEINSGQESDDILFTSITPNYKLSLRQQDVVLSVRSDIPETGAFSHVRIIAEKSNKAAKVTGIKPLNSSSNYFKTSNRSNWHTDVAHFSGVRYTEIYPGINLEFYGNNQEVEYDFIVSPGSDPAQISLSYLGVENINIDANGNAVLSFSGESLTQKKPLVYQDIDGVRTEIESEYIILPVKDHNDTPRLGFSIGQFNPEYDLTIDPVLGYSKLLGGDLYDAGGDLAIDRDGYLYLLGKTFRRAGNTDDADSLTMCSNDCQSSVMISKFDPKGTSLIWKTVLSGSGDDDGRSLKVDAKGNIYIGGWTSSDDFPLRRAKDWSFDGQSEGFLAKLKPDGNSISFSTYVGNGQSEIITAIDLDAKNNIYVAGRSSTPTADESSETAQINTDGFLRKYNSTGQKIRYTRYLKGSGYDSIEALTISDRGQVWVTGSTDSFDFPLRNAIQHTRDGAGDAFLASYNGKTGKLTLSTLHGGERAETGKALALDTSGHIFVAGITNSERFPAGWNDVHNTKAEGTDWDGFVSKFSIDGKSLLFTGFLRGDNNDYISDIALDDSGHIHISGYTYSKKYPFPTLTPGTTTNNDADIFISKMAPDGSSLAYTQRYGSKGEELFANLALHPQGHIVISGITFAEELKFGQPYQLTQPEFSHNGNLFFGLFNKPLQYTIANDQWVSLSLPHTPPENAASIEAILGDDIKGDYGTDWFVYVHQETTDVYKLLAADEKLQPGVAYWVIQNTGKTVFIDMPQGSLDSIQNDPAICGSATPCYSKSLPDDMQKQLHFVANPRSTPLALEDIRLVTSGAKECSDKLGGCSLAEANKVGLIENSGWIYKNGENQSLGKNEIIQPWQGFWIRTQPNLHGSNARLLIKN